MTSNKTLQLRMENRVYNDTTNNRSVNYVRFIVVVNGIEIALKPTDNTSKNILQKYFNEA
ncbi:MAG: hypothetical protein ACI4QL_03715 [Candidatus Fimimonas sp.]